MKSKKQKQEEALVRRKRDIKRWLNPTTPHDKAIAPVKLERAQLDVAALEAKLGLVPSEFIIA